MRRRVAIAFNEPQPSSYDRYYEQKAVLGVIESVKAVRHALFELGDDVVMLPLTPPLEEACRRLLELRADLVFNLFEGFCGQPQTEALLPEMLTQLGLPYSGCQADLLRLAMDKVKIKVILRSAGIATPDFQLINPETLHTFRLSYPCIVKPRGEDASHGINAESVVSNFPSLKKQVSRMYKTYNDGTLVEKFIGGREFNATIIGSTHPVVLPVSEIIYELPLNIPRILTFAAKWENDSVYYRRTKVVCPVGISNGERQYIGGTALAVYRLIGCCGYARVDMRMDESGKLNVLELNPNPDISPDAGAARQAAATGMSYTQFVDKIINLALEKNKHGINNTPYVRRAQAGADADTTTYTRI